MWARSNHIIKRITCFGSIIFVMLLAGCKPFVERPKAEKGFLDLSTWNFEKNGMAQLDGEWEFYWNRLYTPADFSNDSLRKLTTYMKVPMYWNLHKKGDNNFSRQGYATYRLRVKNNITKDFTAIRMPDANSAYKLWINGDLVAAQGIVGKTAEEEKPRLLPIVKIFKGSRDLEIIIQVSNFFNHRPGIWQSITMGTEKQVLNNRDNVMVLNMCLVGTFIILFVYNLFIFFLRRTEYSAIFFSMLSFCFGLRTFIIDDRPILLLFPNLSTDIMYRLQYESFLAACVFFCLFIYSLFPKIFTDRAMKIIVALSILELAIIFTTPTAFYTSLLPVFQFKAFAGPLFCGYVVVKSAIKKLNRALPLCFLMFVLITAGTNDVLFTNSVINTGYMMQYGAFFILLVQAYIVATRISGAYFKFSNLTTELNAANLNLEHKVTERTQELAKETMKADELLLNILPYKNAQELKLHGRSEPRTYKMVTVMMIDMVGFTRVSEQISAELLVAEIDECFSAFDAIMEERGIEKIKTIGDAYLCVGGIPEPNDTHAEDILRAAVSINEFMNKRIADKKLKDEVSFQVRIGINSGAIVTGIVGIKKFAYDIWGDTVKITEAMEQNSAPGRINLSANTYELVKNKFTFTSTGSVVVLNRTIDMYHLV